MALYGDDRTVCLALGGRAEGPEMWMPEGGFKPLTTGTRARSGLSPASGVARAAADFASHRLPGGAGAILAAGILTVLLVFSRQADAAASVPAAASPAASTVPVSAPASSPGSAPASSAPA